MGKPKSSFSFVSSVGRHTPASFGVDMDLHKLVKHANTIGNGANLGVKEFANISGVVNNLELGLRTLNVVGTLIGTLTNKRNSPTNSDSSTLPFVSSSAVNSLGKNDCIYFKTITHVGRSASSRINSIQSGPFVETLTKKLSSSLDDYQEHGKRSQLSLSCGFNEKGFSFLMEDTYMSVKDYHALYRVDSRFRKELNSIKEGNREIYGCALRTSTQFKIKNRMAYYSLHLKIHLIKIMENDFDVRRLITSFTNNTLDPNYKPAGKLPADQQYSNPDLDLPAFNKFSVNFRTSLQTNLNSVSKFEENAMIVKTWTATLPAGSIWDFSLITHLGKGININKINDFYQAGWQEHPGSYILCFEYVGDRRASIVRNVDKDVFSGYSPCQMTVEFETDITYLTDQNDPKALMVYKVSKGEKDFDPEEESDVIDLFYPDRKSPFHVMSDNINYLGQVSKSKQYTLEYDQAVLSTSDIPSALHDLKQVFKDLGLDPASATENDLGYNYKKGPASESTEYFGPMTPPPPESDNSANLRGN